jgi:maintenance of morphology protein 1
MTSNYLFTFRPTFTQGLVLGQLSILILVGLILRYLFLDSTQYPFETSTTYHPRVDSDVLPRKRRPDTTAEEKAPLDGEQEQATESAEWFNVLLKQVGGPLSTATYHVNSPS